MKAVLVVCEGRHDVIFVQRSLGAVAGCSWFDRPIQHLPSPFGSMEERSRKGLVARRMEREVDTFKLREAAYPALPQFESAVVDEAEETLFVMLRANGRDQANAIIEVLRDLDAALKLDPVDVSEYAAAFLFDANAEGSATRLTTFRQAYQGHFGTLADVEHARWLSCKTCRVGVFVVQRSATDSTGTLEDHLAPLVSASWPDHYKSARAFIDDNKCDGDAVAKNDAARLKAIITSAGQFRHPGDPLSTVIARDGIPATQFKQCGLSQDLVEFLQAVPWRDDNVRKAHD